MTKKKVIAKKDIVVLDVFVMLLRLLEKAVVENLASS